jgi:ATP-binding cassette subfamily C protein CydC
MRELIPYLRMLSEYRGRLLLGAVLMLITAASGIGLLALSGWFITATAVTGALMAAGIAASLEIYVPGGGIRMFAVTRTLARYFERIFNHDSVLRLLRDLRGQVFARLAALPTTAMVTMRNGELLNRLTTDIDRLDGLYLRGIAPPIVAGLAILLVMALLAIASTQVAALAGLGLLAIGLITLSVSGLIGQQLTQRLASASAELRASSVDHLNGLAELIAFGSLSDHRDRVLAAAAAERREDSRAAGVLATGEAVIHGATQWVAVVVFLAALGLYQQAHIGGALAVMMPLAVLALLEPLGVLPGAGLNLARARASAERLQAGTKAKATQTISDPQPAWIHAPEVNFSRVRVTRGAGACVLDAFSLALKPGERVGIIGGSGCGKSSVAALLTRQFAADAGVITINQTPLSHFSTDRLYASMGYLTQQTDLFSGTIGTNLRIANRHASDEALWQALEAVDLAGFVNGCDEGLDTWIGESGTQLSGGQARRLALGRLFLRDTPLVILDEPLSNLDAATSARVAAALDTWLSGRTTLVLGHEFSAMPPVERAFTLKAGRLQRHESTGEVP